MQTQTIYTDRLTFRLHNSSIRMVFRFLTFECLTSHPFILLNTTTKQFGLNFVMITRLLFVPIKGLNMFKEGSLLVFFFNFIQKL